MGFPSWADILLSLPAVLWAITFHEFCHGYVAYKLGDDTPLKSGRLTLNPLAHLDPIGALMLLIFRFGWAKPVPISTRNFKNPRRDLVLVSPCRCSGQPYYGHSLCANCEVFPCHVLDELRSFEVCVTHDHGKRWFGGI